MPWLVGQPADSALIVLAAMHLQPGTQTLVRSPQPAGMVVGQSPDSGQFISPGTVVTMRVSAGISRTAGIVAPPIQQAESVSVPDLHDSTLAGAAMLLKRVGLGLRPVDASPAAKTTGRIVAQKPLAGRLVPRGSMVAVEVQVKQQVVVPDLTGLSPEAARTRLEGVGLLLGDVSQIPRIDATGRVFYQKPAAEDTVPRGTSVVAGISIPFPRVDVPPVVGLTEKDAVRTIEAAGLVAAPITHSPRPSGNLEVVTEHPEAGTMVARGSAVALDVAVPLPPPARVMVPHVEGRTPAEADAILENVELHLGNVVVMETTATANRVLHQDPPADAVVDTGTEVSLTVSKPLRRDTVPEVRGQWRATAESTLAARHFTLTITDTASDRADSGRVVDQDPPGGTEVTPGSEVELQVGVYAPTPLWLKLLAAMGGIGGGVYGLVRLRQWRRDRPWRGRVTITPRSEAEPPGRIDTDNLLAGPELGLVPRVTPISAEVVEDEPLIEGESS